MSWKWLLRELYLHILGQPQVKQKSVAIGEFTMITKFKLIVSFIVQTLRAWTMPQKWPSCQMLHPNFGLILSQQCCLLQVHQVANGTLDWICSLPYLWAQNDQDCYSPSLKTIHVCCLHSNWNSVFPTYYLYLRALKEICGDSNLWPIDMNEA